MAGRAETIRAEPGGEDPSFDRCREVIRSGGLIIYPTDTYYGLGVDPRQPEAVNRLFTVKSRAADQPILLLLSDASEVLAWAAEVPRNAERLMQAFWPGPLTLVFRARPDVLPQLTAGSGTIGLRVPGNALTRRLLHAVGTALTGTSANRSGGQSARTVGDIGDPLLSGVDLIVDIGPTAGGSPSTVVDISGAVPRMIREGAIAARMIAAAG